MRWQELLEGKAQGFVRLISTLASGIGAGAETALSGPIVNRQFVDRNIDSYPSFEYIQKKFSDDPYQANAPAVVLYGRPGIGKKEIVNNFFHHNRTTQKYRRKFWINASSIESLSDDYTKLYYRENLQFSLTLSSNVLTKVKEYLEKQENWLIVYADIKDNNVIQYLPSSGCIHILITTTLRNWSANYNSVEININDDEAASIFVQNTKWKKSDEAVKKLVLKADRLPATLVFIRIRAQEIHLSLPECLQQFVQITELSNEFFLKQKQYWSESLNLIKKEHKFSQQLLIICAFLKGDSIPSALLKTLFERRSFPEDIDYFNARSILYKHFLLSESAENPQTLRISQSVQSILLEDMEDKEEETQLLFVLNVLQAIFYSGESPNFDKMKDCAEQLKFIIEQAHNETILHIRNNLDVYFDLIHSLALYNYLAMDLSEAKKFIDKAKELAGNNQDRLFLLNILEIEITRLTIHDEDIKNHKLLELCKIKIDLAKKLEKAISENHSKTVQKYLRFNIEICKLFIAHFKLDLKYDGLQELEEVANSFKEEGMNIPLLSEHARILLIVYLLKGNDFNRLKSEKDHLISILNSRQKCFPQNSLTFSCLKILIGLINGKLVSDKPDMFFIEGLRSIEMHQPLLWENLDKNFGISSLVNDLNEKDKSTVFNMKSKSLVEPLRNSPQGGEVFMQSPEETTKELEEKKSETKPKENKFQLLCKKVNQLSTGEQLHEDVKKMIAAPARYGLTENGLCHRILKAKQDNISEEEMRKSISQIKADRYTREVDSIYRYSAVHWCIVSNYPNLALSLCKEGFDPNANDVYGLTPMHAATIFEQRIYLRGRFELQPSFSELTIQHVSLNGQSITITLNELSIAVIARKMSVMKDIFEIFKERHSPINPEIAGIGNILHLIIYVAKVEDETEVKIDKRVAHNLLEFVMQQEFIGSARIAILLTQKVGNFEQCSPLMLAAKYGQVGLMCQLITYMRTHVDEVQGQGELDAAYYAASRAGQKQAVQVLFYYGYKPEAGHSYNELIKYLNTKIALGDDEKAKEEEKELGHNCSLVQNVTVERLHNTNYGRYNKPITGSQPYDNLVLQGGGGKGFAFPYALKAFKEFCTERSASVVNPHQKETLSFDNIVRVAGTSAGAIFAMALAVGYTPESLEDYLDYDFSLFLESDRINEIVKELDEKNPNFRTIIDELLKHLNIQLNNVAKAVQEVSQSNHPTASFIWQGATHGRAIWKEIQAGLGKINELNSQFKGFSSGIVALGFLQKLLTDKKLSPDLTFGELAELVKKEPGRYKHLYIAVTNLTQNKFEVLSSENPIYKNYIILHTARSSMSYPLAFAPHHLFIKEDGVIKKLSDEYIDGGALRNYLIDEFDLKRFSNTDHVGDPRFPEFNPRTIGFRFKIEQSENTALPSTSDEKSTSMISRLRAFINLYVQAEELISHHMDREYHRSVVLDTGPITTFTFKQLDYKEKALLSQNSKDAMSVYSGKNKQRSGIGMPFTTSFVPFHYLLMPGALYHPAYYASPRLPVHSSTAPQSSNQSSSSDTPPSSDASLAITQRLRESSSHPLGGQQPVHASTTKETTESSLEGVNSDPKPSPP